MLFYPAALPLSSRTLTYVAGVIHRHRKKTGSRWRVMPGIAEMVIQLAFQGAPGHHLGQPAQQPALTGQPQPARAGPLGKLTQQLLIGRRQLRRLLALPDHHICHW